MLRQLCFPLPLKLKSLVQLFQRQTTVRPENIGKTQVVKPPRTVETRRLYSPLGPRSAGQQLGSELVTVATRLV